MGMGRFKPNTCLLKDKFWTNLLLLNQETKEEEYNVKLDGFFWKKILLCDFMKINIRGDSAVANYIFFSGGLFSTNYYSSPSMLVQNYLRILTRLVIYLCINFQLIKWSQ